MDKKTGILDFLSQVFMLYGIAILILNIFCLIFGESAKGISTIFSLGSSGLQVSTMMQFLLAVFLTALLRFLVMTDTVIKKMPLAARIVTMFAGVLGIMFILIFAFGWFPVGEPMAWIMFFLSFALSCIISTAISVIAEKQENKKLDEALKKYRGEQ